LTVFLGRKHGNFDVYRHMHAQDRIICIVSLKMITIWWQWKHTQQERVWYDVLGCYLGVCFSCLQNKSLYWRFCEPHGPTYFISR